jgi:hypothetical protein
VVSPAATAAISTLATSGVCVHPLLVVLRDRERAGEVALGHRERFHVTRERDALLDVRATLMMPLPSRRAPRLGSPPADAPTAG